MSHREMLKFGETYIEKSKFHTSKKDTDTKDAKTGNILTSNKNPIKKKCFKYFIGYVNFSNDDNKTFLIWLPKFKGRIKSF